MDLLKIRLNPIIFFSTFVEIKKRTFAVNLNHGGLMKCTIIFVLSSLLLAGCSSLILKPADFSWPVESVMKVDRKGMIEEQRNNFSVNVKGLLFAETQDSINVTTHTLHLIRDIKGYYFITGPKFKNVYVFEQAEGGLKLAAKILIKEQGLEDPAFNQKAPYIQLLNEKDKPLLLSKDGILEGGKK